MKPFNWIQWLTLVLAVTVALTTPILYLRISHIQEHQNDALRSIICRAESFIRHDPSLSSAQRRQALRFYEDSLASIHAAPCSGKELH